MTRAAWLGLLPSLPPGTHEVMVHPGEADPAEAERLAPETGRSRLETLRQAELDALCDPDVRAAAAARGIRFIPFPDLIYSHGSRTGNPSPRGKSYLQPRFANGGSSPPPGED
jgi:hypothetical protein